MKIILVTGVEESGRKDLLEIARKGAKKLIPKTSFIDFDEIISGVAKKAKAGYWDIGSIKEMIGVQQHLYSELQKKMGAMKGERNVILNGYIELRTKNGFMPVISEDFFRMFKVNMIILVEAVTSGLDEYEIKKLFGSIDSFREIALQQQINLEYASAYSVFNDSMLKIIKVDRGNIKEALKHMIETLEFCAN